MMTYGELNLKCLREKCDIDFAHYTYQKGMCSCCYGPADLPAKYWRDNKVIPSDDPRYENISYILFKNSNNGIGEVRAKDTICQTSDRQRKWGMFFGTHSVCIEWGLNDLQLDKVLKELRRQLDEDYHVIRPKDHMECIQIKLTQHMKPEDWEREVRLDPYRPVEYAAKEILEKHLFTCECRSTGDKYIALAEDLAQATELCQHLIEAGFELDHLVESQKPGIYY